MQGEGGHIRADLRKMRGFGRLLSVHVRAELLKFAPRACAKIGVMLFKFNQDGAYGLFGLGKKNRYELNLQAQNLTSPAFRAITEFS